ncbi:hypothetical protein B0H12DRAFT_1079548 [Mycena haematopus]|nr:hypothetical protein B0H12DRAFT_1079548 [Mycena haematopus]
MPPSRDHDRNDLDETCRQCPTQTLISQCPHSPEGRDYLKEQRNLRQRTPEPSNVSRPPWFNYWLSPPKRANETATYNNPWFGSGPVYGMPAFSNQSMIDPALFQNGGGAAPMPTTPLVPFTPSTAVLTVSSTASLTGASTVLSAGVPLASSAGALTPLSAGAPPLSSAGASAARSSSPADSNHSDSARECSSTPATQTKRRQRLRATKKNPVHGEVEGAMRGAKKIDIVRQKELRDPLSDQAEASARFLRCVSDIIDRCERVSHETGWRISALHVPRFLREAKKDAEQITNHLNRIYASLIAARNEESKEMHKRLLSAEDDKKAAEGALAAARQAEREARRELELQAEELAAQRLELVAWQAKLKVAQRKSGVSQ